jgi:hypothetical protein
VPKLLVACEYSGRVRDAFAALGWNAWSCDLLPSETPGNHHQGAVEDILSLHWDVPSPTLCTHLAVSGARWFKASRASSPVVRPEHIALENPVSIISTRIRRPTQVIQPWQFGHGETKATCLWLKNLPPLTPTDIVEGRENKVHRMPPGPNRWKERSRTYSGIASAMATQWTSHWNAQYPDRQLPRAAP